jgi:hypothetical protein
MGFSNFVLEDVAPERVDDIFETLRQIGKQCKPFLKHRSVLYRGMDRVAPHGVKTLRTDRRPRDSGSYENAIFSLLARNYNLPPRSELLFTTADKQLANVFGEVNYIFPIGQFKSYFFPKILDVVDSFPHVISEYIPETEIDSFNSLQELLDRCNELVSDNMDSVVNDKELSVVSSLFRDAFKDEIDNINYYFKSLMHINSKDLNSKNEIMLYGFKQYYFINVTDLAYVKNHIKRHMPERLKELYQLLKSVGIK